MVKVRRTQNRDKTFSDMTFIILQVRRKKKKTEEEAREREE
jgi:hypothetical protein